MRTVAMLLVVALSGCSAPFEGAEPVGIAQVEAGADALDDAAADANPEADARVPNGDLGDTCTDDAGNPNIRLCETLLDSGMADRTWCVRVWTNTGHDGGWACVVPCDEPWCSSRGGECVQAGGGYACVK